MTDWGSLTHAYGPAGDVPAILAAADASDAESGKAWDDAWSRLCHQGTVYPASYAALPILRQIAERRPPAGYLAAVGLAACIVSSTDGPREPAEVRQTYAGDIDALRSIAERALGLATSDTDFVYTLEALLAFEDGGIWQHALSHLANEEVPLTCPHCTELLVLEPTENPSVSAFPGGGRSSNVMPGEPRAGTVEHRMSSVARVHQRDELARQITLLIGRTSCPLCGSDFDVPTGVRGYYAGA